MRKLGIITNINQTSITIAVSPSNQVTYLTYPYINYPYQLLSIVEYTKDSITPILDNNFTKEELKELSNILKVLMDNPTLSQAFLEGIDLISPKPSK